MRKRRYRVRVNSISDTSAHYRGHRFFTYPQTGDGTRWVHCDSGRAFYISGLDEPKGAVFTLGADKLIAELEKEPNTEPLFVVCSEGGLFERAGNRSAPIRIYKDGRVFDDITAASRQKGRPFAGFNPAFREYFGAGRLLEIAEFAEA